MKISEIINIAKKRWYLLLVFPLVFGGLAAFYSYSFMPNQYMSSTSIYVVQRVEIVDQTDNTTQYAPNWGLSGQVIGDVLTLIKSSKAREAIMKEMGLSNLNDFTINVASAEKNSRVVNITVTGYDPYDVAKVANCTAHEVAKITSEQMYVDEIMNVLEEAQPSLSPCGPNRKIFILGAAAIGFCFALIISFLKFILDTTFKSANEVKEMEDLTILAQIPQLKYRSKA